MVRIPLRPKVQYVSSFVPKSDSLYQLLVESVTWDESMRARKTASFGVPYNYSHVQYPESEMPAELTRIGERIRWHFDMLPNTCLVNYYPTGESSMGFHSDATEELKAGTGIAIISLGAVRTLSFQSKEDKSVVVDFSLEPGSLLFMPLAVQEDWKHGLSSLD